MFIAINTLSTTGMQLNDDFPLLYFVIRLTFYSNSLMIMTRIRLRGVIK